MMKRILTLLTLLPLFAHADMLHDAKKEGWTFHFNTSGKKYYTGLIKPHGIRSEMTPVDLSKDDTPIPDTYDLRPKLTQIENQGSCGSCWSFSLTATLRDAYALAGKDPGRLSQQYLVDCDTQNYGCNGGTFEAARLFVDPKGAPLLSAYPYTAKNGRCKASKPEASILNWHYVGDGQHAPAIEDVQRAILKYGEVSVDVGADNVFSSYEAGIYNACRNTGINHMTNLVGWNNKEGYWIMRNSWGTNWGEDGWMRIKMKDKNGRRCNNLATTVSFYEIKDPGPPPPPPASFKLDNAAVHVEGVMKAGHEKDVDKAKTFVGDAIDKL